MIIILRDNKRAFERENSRLGTIAQLRMGMSGRGPKLSKDGERFI